jgi:hypothetical protein
MYVFRADKISFKFSSVDLYGEEHRFYDLTVQINWNFQSSGQFSIFGLIYILIKAGKFVLIYRPLQIKLWLRISTTIFPCDDRSNQWFLGIEFGYHYYESMFFVAQLFSYYWCFPAICAKIYLSTHIYAEHKAKQCNFNRWKLSQMKKASLKT